ncbi:hypothetical protein RB195_006757 [Necator americanus]|uniref:Uncharacterized protein n=1 Tax=Necator americanus TaxID=51031 RepID=A0ABR1BXX9_NECAM
MRVNVCCTSTKPNLLGLTKLRLGPSTIDDLPPPTIILFVWFYFEVTPHLPDLKAGSLYTPTKDTIGSSFDPTFDVQYLPYQDTGLPKKYFMVEEEQQELLQLFRFCPQCEDSRRKHCATSPARDRICRTLSLDEMFSRRRPDEALGKTEACYSQRQDVQGQCCGCSCSDNNRTSTVELERWAKQFGLALFSKSTFWRYFGRTKPALEEVYGRHQSEVLSKVREHNKDGLDLAADGAYDSRGYSALIGKVPVCDLETKLVLHTEVLHRTENTGECQWKDGD